ncbi:MAG: tetratricopeptide repeat protein [Acidobacteriota bacterium]|nr:tetratricopeptide repeat protein [Acidobacteriota bacterium]
MQNPLNSILAFVVFAAMLMTNAPSLLSGASFPKPSHPADDLGCIVSIERAREGLAASPGDPSRQFSLALRLSNCGNDIEAAVWYREVLRARPGDGSAWYALGDSLARLGEYKKAEQAFRQMLKLDPGNAGAELGLAHAETRLGRWDDAMALYKRVLVQEPDNYEALQGKGLILYWTRHYEEALPVFQRLLHENPGEDENRQALAAISRSIDVSRWSGLRPTASAPPQAWMGYEISYLADHSPDPAHLERLARAEARLGAYEMAVRNDQHALRLSPADNAAQEEMGRALGWDHRFAASIEAYNELLRTRPRDREALESLVRVCVWSRRYEDALAAQKKLAAIDPGNAAYQLEEARLELALNEENAAFATLGALIAQHPQNRQARIERARLMMRRGNFTGALEDYNAVLAENFKDAEASYGAAQIYYYLGRPDRAYPFAVRAAAERPEDFDALILCARIEQARRQPRQARAFLDRASRLNPSSPEIEEIEEQHRGEHRVTVHTSSTYSREQAFQDRFITPGGFAVPSRREEDLNSYGSSVKTSFSFLPRSDSYVLVASMPSNSPVGGIQGAVAPSELIYGQTTKVSKFMTVRGGFGGVRIGPGAAFNVASPTPPVSVPGITPVGYAGLSIFPTPRLSLSFSADRSALTYTPTSVRFGVMRKRIEAGLFYAPNMRTSLSVTYDLDALSSPVYYQSVLYLGGEVLLERNGRDNGSMGSVILDRNLVRRPHFTLDAGYSGLAFGYAGRRRGAYMGFFNPKFYQHHLLTAHAGGRLWGPFSYSLAGGAGVQQVEQGAPFTRAFEIGPSLSIRASRTLSLTAGYYHYDFAQSLGSVRGDAVTLSTDWTF